MSFSTKKGNLILRTQPVRMEEKTFIEIQESKTRTKVFESKSYGKPKFVFSRFLNVYKSILGEGGDFIVEFNNQSTYRLILEEDKREFLSSCFVYRYFFNLEKKTIRFLYNNNFEFPLSISELEQSEKSEILAALKELYDLGFEVNEVGQEIFRLKYLLKI